MIRRYDVRLGVPSSVTARMTWAVPGVLGITVAADVSPFVTVMRGFGVGRPPAGCGAMALTSAGAPGLLAAAAVADARPARPSPAARALDASPVVAALRAARPPAAPGMPVPASG